MNDANYEQNYHSKLAQYLPIKDLCLKQNILDIMCGEGSHLNRLIEWGAKSVIAIENNEKLLESMLNKNLSEQVSIIKAIPEEIPDLFANAAIDGIILHKSIIGVVYLEHVLMGIKKILTPNSWLFITIDNLLHHPEGNKNTAQNFSRDEFLRISGNVLGNPTQSGECYAFLGYATFGNEIKINEDVRRKPNFELSSPIGLGSGDSEFSYFFWGNYELTTIVSGSPQRREILAPLRTSQSNIQSEDLTHVSRLKELSVEYQKVLEGLVEAQNQLHTIKILVSNLDDSDEEQKKEKIKSLASYVKGIFPDVKDSLIRKLAINPPKLVLFVYLRMPTRLKDKFRQIRRNIIQ